MFNGTVMRGLILLLLALSLPAMADEGMFLLTDPPRQVLKDRYGFDLTDRWLERAMGASVRFNNGGSGGFVSPAAPPGPGAQLRLRRGALPAHRRQLGGRGGGAGQDLRRRRARGGADLGRGYREATQTSSFESAVTGRPSKPP